MPAGRWRGEHPHFRTIAIATATSATTPPTTTLTRDTIVHCLYIPNAMRSAGARVTLSFSPPHSPIRWICVWRDMVRLFIEREGALHAPDSLSLWKRSLLLRAQDALSRKHFFFFMYQLGENVLTFITFSPNFYRLIYKYVCILNLFYRTNYWFTFYLSVIAPSSPDNLFIKFFKLR